MAIKLYRRTVLTGGTSDALDGIDGAILNDGDECRIYDSNDRIYFYRLDASLGSSENAPSIIVPDQNAGSKCWVLQNVFSASVLSTMIPVSAYPSLSAAITAIGSDTRTLIIDQPITLTADVTIPSNVILQILHGGIITFGTYNITCNGPFECGIYQAFHYDSTGKITFGNGTVEKGYAEWWGAVADGVTDCATAINAALQAVKRVIGLEGVYVIDTQISVLNSRWLVGSGENQTIYKKKDSLDDFMFKIPGTFSTKLNYIKFSNLSIDGGGSSNGNGGIYMAWSYMSYFDNVNVVGFAKTGAIGIKVENCFNISILSCRTYIISNGIGVLVSSTSGGQNVTQIKIDDHLSQICDIGYEFSFVPAADGLIITNSAANCTTGILFADGGGQKAIRISENHLEGCDTAIRATSASNARNVQILNNYFWDDAIGIDADNVQDWTVSCNQFNGTPASGRVAVKCTDCSSWYEHDNVVFSTAYTLGNMYTNTIPLKQNDKKTHYLSELQSDIGIAISILGDNECVLVLNTDFQMYMNLEIPENITVICQSGTIHVYTYQLIIRGPFICPPNLYIFNDSFSGAAVHLVNYKGQFFPAWMNRNADTLPTRGTFQAGIQILKDSPSAGGSPGWVCTQSGTFSSATETGDTDGSTATITNVADTSDFFVGQYVTVSAGFPSATTPYQIISIVDNTSITLDTDSTSAQTGVTIDTPDPVFKAMANLAS